MHYCSWYQPQPIYLHRQIHRCLFSSIGTYEDNTCFNHGVLLLWEGGSQSPSCFWDGHSCGWNGLVWQCLIKAWWKGTQESLSPYQQNRNKIVWHHPLILVFLCALVSFAKVEHTKKIADPRKVILIIWKWTSLVPNYFQPHFVILEKLDFLFWILRGIGSFLIGLGSRQKVFIFTIIRRIYLYSFMTHHL